MMSEKAGRTPLPSPLPSERGEGEGHVRVKVSVLGAGALGKEHARIYSELAAAKHVEFVGVYDVSAEVGRKIAEKYGVREFQSVVEAAEASDALSIVTPTTTHFEIARTLLQKGK